MSSREKLPPGIYKVGNSYQAVVSRGRGISPLKKNHATKEDAQAWKATQELLKRGGRNRLPNRGLTVADAWTNYLRAPGIAANTLKHYADAYRVRIEPVLGRIKLADITPQLLDGFAADLADDYAPAGVKYTVDVLSSVLNRAVRDGMMAANPRKLMAPLPRIPRHEARVLAPEEADALLKVSPPEYLPLWATLRYTGMRIGEALALKVGDVRFAMNAIRVHASAQEGGPDTPYTKNGDERWVGMPAPLAELLLPLVSGRAWDAHLFVGPKGAQLRYRTVRSRVWQPMLEAANLPDPQPSPHDLRHTIGFHLGERGYSDRQIADILGHKSTRTTAIYVHPSMETVKRMAADLADL